MTSAVKDIPEKMGQVIAAVHSLMIAKTLRRVTKGTNLNFDNATANGVLVDRLTGVIFCKGEINFSSAEAGDQARMISILKSLRFTIIVSVY